WGEECLSDHHLDRGPFSDTGWEIYPLGLLAVLQRYSRLDLPLMITENGVATRDEDLRQGYLREHLAAMGEAIERGSNVLGYLYWSLMDNFEWALGRGPRFGLAEVDFETQRRTPRPAAADFAAICRSRRLYLPEAEGGAS
ncbi:MAG: family 1 glycosylhydrolase, partial [Vicinamibacteria bacterium]